MNDAGAGCGVIACYAPVSRSAFTLGGGVEVPLHRLGADPAIEKVVILQNGGR